MKKKPWEEPEILEISVLIMEWSKSTGAAAGGGDSNISLMDHIQKTVKTEEHLTTLIHLCLQQQRN